jgi:hypothetical protein
MWSGGEICHLGSEKMVTMLEGGVQEEGGEEDQVDRIVASALRRRQ